MIRKDYYLEWRPVEMRSLMLPSIRSNSAGAFMNHEMVIFGGKGANQFNEIWKFSSSKLIWELIDVHGDDIPLPRDGHSFTKISENKFFIFGGQGHVLGTKVYEKQTENGKAKCLSIRKLFDDFYYFDCENLTWYVLPRRKIAPPGRRGHSMLYISSNLLAKSSFISQFGPILSDGPGYLLLFGGSCVDLNSSVEKPNNDMWLFSLDTLEWEPIYYQESSSSPSPLYGHCAEIIDHFMVVVGGNIASPSPQHAKGLKGLTIRQEENHHHHSNHKSIFVFNLLTFQWSHLQVNNTTNSNRLGLNLLGHSIVRSPLDSQEIWIFGGRRTDELNLSDDEILRERSLPAPILSFHLQTCELSLVEIRNSSGKSPESRLNQVFLRVDETNVDLSSTTNEEPQQQTTPSLSSSSSPSTVMIEQSLIRLYGGSKLYSSGYCDGDIYDLFLVPSPVEPPTLLATLSQASSFQEFESSPTIPSKKYTRKSSISSLRTTTQEGSDEDDESIVSEFSNDRQTYHRLQLKEDSSVRLMAPKSGIEGKYFLIKTELSHSKSTFTTEMTPSSLPKLSQKKSSFPSPSSSSSHSPLSRHPSSSSLSPPPSLLSPPPHHSHHLQQLTPIDYSSADTRKSKREGNGNSSSPTHPSSHSSLHLKLNSPAKRSKHQLTPIAKGL